MSRMKIGTVTGPERMTALPAAIVSASGTAALATITFVDTEPAPRAAGSVAVNVAVPAAKRVDIERGRGRSCRNRDGSGPP